MKAKYILLSGALFTLFSTSCSDFLEEDPKGQLTPSTFFSTQEELDMSTYALYQKVCLIQTNTNPTIPSWQGDDLTTNPGSNKQAYAEVDAFRPTDANKGVEAAWQTSYTCIKAANYIILNAERTPTTDEEINIAIGQAKYWRAVNYFWLVRRWGQVPLVLDNEVNYERPLASVEEIYAQIEQDLVDCVNTLPTDYSSAPRKVNGANVYITKQAAQSTLAAVYMAMAGWPLKKTEYYAKAAEQAKAVIDGVNAGTYEYILEPEYKYVYAPSHNYTNETVVGINYSRDFTWVEDSQMTSSNLFESLGGWGDGWGEIKFWKEFPAGPRKDATFNPKILQVAYECINKVRERAGLEPLQQGLSGDAFANAALAEHGWEVAGYWVALVTRRDDQMRMELLEQTFNERKANEPIEVAPGVMRKNQVEISAGTTWQGEKSIYLPYPSTDTQLNPNLKR